MKCEACERDTATSRGRTGRNGTWHTHYVCAYCFWSFYVDTHEPVVPLSTEPPPRAGLLPFKGDTWYDELGHWFRADGSYGGRLSYRERKDRGLA